MIRKLLFLIAVSFGPMFGQCGFYAFNGVTGNLDCIGKNGTTSVAIQASGVSQGTAGTVNILGGLTVAVGGGVASVSPDTAILDTRQNNVWGIDKLIVPASASGTTYTGCPTANSPTAGNAISSLKTGSIILFKPDVNGSGGATTLTPCAMSPIGIKEADGATNPTATDIVAGRFYELMYDGTNFRLPIVNSCATSGGQPWYQPFASSGAGSFLYDSTKVTVAAITPWCSVTFTHVAFTIGVANSSVCTGGTCALSFAIYTAAGALVSQSAKVLQGGSPDLNTAATVDIAWGSTVTLVSGTTYYIGVLTDSATVQLYKQGQSAVDPGTAMVSAFASFASFGKSANAPTGDGSGLTAPATLGVVTAANPPDGFTRPVIVILR